jgi:acyl carrier protein
MSDVAGAVWAVMAAVFRLDAGRIDGTASAETVEAWDSLQHLNLILALEQRFGISFSVEDISTMTDYAAIVETVARAAGASDREGSDVPAR